MTTYVIFKNCIYSPKKSNILSSFNISFFPEWWEVVQQMWNVKTYNTYKGVQIYASLVFCAAECMLTFRSFDMAACHDYNNFTSFFSEKVPLMIFGKNVWVSESECIFFPLSWKKIEFYFAPSRKMYLFFY